MKKQYRFLSVLLIAALLAAVPAAVQAEYDAGVSVYIPNKIERLHLPDMPEYIVLHTRTQSVATYGNPDDPTDPCPILPVSEPDIELFFSEQPEQAAVLWSEGIEYINVNEAGYARVSSAGHKLQPGVVAGTMLIKDDKTGEQKRVWAATTADHKAGDPVPQEMLDGAFLASKDGVTTLYNRNGTPVWVEYSIPDDFYKTGIDGAVTTIRWNRVVIDGDYYVYEKDENGKPVYEDGIRKKHNLKGVAANITMKDGSSVYLDAYDYEKFNFMKEGKGVCKAKLSVKEDGYISINLYDETNSFYVGTYDYSRFEFPDLGVYTAELTQMDGYVNFKLYDEQGEYVAEIDFTNEEIIKDNLDELYSDVSAGDISFIHWYYTTWYISQVVTTYPDDINYIVRVESDWKNNSGQFLWGYKITYATSAKERYKITYNPDTTTIVEDHNTGSYSFTDPISGEEVLPSRASTDLEAYFSSIGDVKKATEYHNIYYHHYEEDTPIYGEYTDGTLELVSGSGDFLNYWYEKGHGARVYKYLYPCTYFSTPRYR